MARHYYLTRSGRLRRKDNTLAFEPAAETEEEKAVEESSAPEVEAENFGAVDSMTGDGLGADFLGNLDFESPAALDDEKRLTEILDGEAPGDFVAPRAGIPQIFARTGFCGSFQTCFSGQINFPTV